MRVVGWALIVAGLLLGVASFVIPHHFPTHSPWPPLTAGFALTALGVVVLIRSNLGD